MSTFCASSALPLGQVIQDLHLGLIVVDESRRVVLWNAWVERHSRIDASAALGRHIEDAFAEPPSPAFLKAIDNTLQYRLPVVLSNALHRAPLPLYETHQLDAHRHRLYQSLTLSPLALDETQLACLIQISDATRSIKREKMLRLHSESLRMEATTDALTGLYNRRFFDEHYRMVFGHAQRHAMPLAVLMVDIDFFKEYNDYYGHPAGDKVLACVGQTLKKQLMRANDVVARYGGEEFVLMLPNTSLEAATLFAERLRVAVQAQALPHARSHIAPTLSVSIGVSQIHDMPEIDQNQLLFSADTALYQAKKEGRNRVASLAPAQALQMAAAAGLTP